MMTDRHYVHVGGARGRDRLRVLAKIFRPKTEELLARAGLVRGLRCLDIGCGGGDVSVLLAQRVGPEGHVTAIDFDGEKLDIARQEVEHAGLQNLEYVQTDLFDLAAEGQFDLVYTRFVLTHLQDPAAALRRARRLLKTGGMIVVEDADASANFSAPPESAFELYSKLYRASMRARNTDPDIGPKLPQLLVQAGFSDIEINIHQPAELKAGDIKLLVALTLDSVAEPAIQAGLATSEEVSKASKRLHQLATEDSIVMSLPRVVQCWARAPL